MTDKGKIRRSNQDYFSIRRCEAKACSVIALCDGLGGSSGGENASEISTRTFVEYVFSKLTSRTNKNPNYKNVLLNACFSANETVYDYSQFDPELNQMGTTIVGGIVEDGGLVRMINVGDSRAYLISNDFGITQITTDHSLVEDLVKSGVISREKARTHPQKNIITRAVGTDPEVQADYYEFNLAPGDMLLLCSDGLSNYVTEEEMLAGYKLDADPEIFCRNMLALTFEKGAGDNVTIISMVNE